jgi:predicted SprT family Zn-dependent metalloprotease
MILQYIVDCKWVIACDMFPEMKQCKKPRVEFNKRLRTTCARVFLAKNIIEVNAGLFFKYPSEFEKQIIMHEIAHIIDNHFYPKNYLGRSVKNHHSHTWQNIMIVLGLEPLQYSPAWMI